MVKFSPSQLQNPDENFRYAKQIYASVSLLLLLYMAIMALTGAHLHRFAAPFVILLCAAVSLAFQYQSKPRSGLFVFIWGIWLAVTLQAVIRNGIGNPSLFAYPALFLLAGWVLRIRQGFYLGIASILASLGIAFAESRGWIVGQISVPPLERWQPMFVVFLASMAAMYFILKTHWDELHRSYELNNKLEQTIAVLSEREHALQISEAQFQAMNEQLEQRVQERTVELSQALETIKRAQDELVHSEKLASLGSLVAGVAHELNTPIGNALVTTTTIVELSSQMEQEFKSGNMRKSALEQFLVQCREGALLAERSLHRASELVNSFKQVAVDQASERKRKFDLAEMVTEVVDTLRPNLRGTPWQLEMDIPGGIKMDSYPGPLGQIVINLVMNAILHGFDGLEQGTVRITAVSNLDKTVTLVCRDDGKGISVDNLSRIFDPFFTTKLGKGGSGLGLSIVHRLVTQVLEGTISVYSRPGEGAAFTLLLPLVPVSSVNRYTAG
jgi:signal transduction histidine kinase